MNKTGKEILAELGYIEKRDDHEWLVYSDGKVYIQFNKRLREFSAFESPNNKIHFIGRKEFLGVYLIILEQKWFD